MNLSIDQIAALAVKELHGRCECCTRPMTETALAGKYGVKRLNLHRAIKRYQEQQKMEKLRNETY